MKLPFSEKLSVKIYRVYRQILWHSPTLHKLYLKLRGYPIDLEHIDLVVQGFARSGNTFATEAIHACSSEKISVFSHIHVPVVVYEAIRTNTPVCFLVRAPEDTITSLSLHSNWSIERCLDHYVEYHRIIKKMANSICIFEFSKFIGDINYLLSGLNTHFEMNFPAISHKDMEAIIFDRIEKRQIVKHGEIDESTIHRPSLVRKQAKNKLLIDLEMHETLLLEARNLFAFFKNKAVEVQH